MNDNDYYKFMKKYDGYARRCREAEMDEYDPFQLRKEPSRKQVVDPYEGFPYDSGAYMLPTLYGTAGPSKYAVGTEPRTGYRRTAGPLEYGT